MHAILQQHNLRPATQPSSTRSGRPAASSIPAPVPSAAQFIRQSTPAANRQLSQINHRHPMPPPPAAAAAAPATAAGSLASQVQSILVDESRRAMTASSSSVSRTNARQSTEGRLFPFSTIDDILQPARSAQSANSVAAMALWSSRLSSATTDRDGAAIPTMAEGEEGGLFGQSTSSPGGRSLHHRIAEELARLVRLPTTTAQTPIENLHASSSLATSSWNKSADHHQHPYARPPTEGSASRPPIAGGGGASLLSSMVHSPPPLRVLPVQPSSTLFNSSPGGRQHAGGGGGGGHASKSQHPSGSIDVAGCTTPDAASSVSVLLSVLESAPNEQLLAIVKAVVVRLLDRCAAVTKSSDVARASSSRRNTRTHASIAKPSDVLDQLCSIYAEATGAVAGNEAVPPSQDQRDEEEGLPNSAQEQQQQQQPSASASAQPVRSATASVVCPDEDPVDDVSWQASPPRRLQRRVNSHPSSNAAAGEGAAGSGNSLLGKWSDTATFENGPSRSSTMQYKASSVYSSGSGSGTVTRNEEDETHRYHSAGGGGGNPEFVLQRQILILRREREEAKQEVAQLQRELHRMASEAEPSLYETTSIQTACA